MPNNMPSNVKCLTCKFVSIDDQDVRCRRSPPVVSQVSEVFLHEEYAVWPRVDQHDWCGEWRDGSTVDAPEQAPIDTFTTTRV